MQPHQKRPAPPQAALRLRDVMYAGAALNVVALVVVIGVGLATLDPDEIAAATAVPGAPDAALAGVVIAFAVVLWLLEAALWLLFGRLFARGYAWARWTGTALAAANLLVEVPRLVNPANTLGLAITVVEIVVIAIALVILWSPPVSRYVREVSAWRAAVAV